MFIDYFMDDIAYVRVVTYHGAFAMALRILNWDLCVMTMLDLLAQPHSSIPYRHIGLITAR